MNTHESSNAGPSHKSVEIAVAILVMAFGAIVIFGSTSVGIGWGAEGPQAGFFPFYIGLAIVISGAVNLVNALRPDAASGIFAEWSQLRQVLLVVIPASIYAVAVGYIGIYVSSAIFIAWFMRWLGKYSWPKVAAVAIGMPVIVYLVFEKWFLVALPKGPIENWLNL
ncbi:tripartite tricarboxylate transporter TctB family protein [Pseudorhodoplanes sp.]|jgi:putative tricarboxylic transport membrane protein|uniref:tripartite tricarboxylate transporter TctB family protein n=1 Tax=Pseudorhodoplanes sp. TaxID=1934341 RepID=UPI002C5FD7BD|nr:tripartite tricarboxylate transporter TctB family protein [Pseudorhodoplanes sp.]HWV41524.1 tripartite tricarboxylate transporter TctB family protein [Pseudorhodoplanes sp.]